MSSHLLAVRSFLDKVKSLSFWGRIFEWSRVKQDLVDAASSLATAQSEMATAEHNLASGNLHLSVAKKLPANSKINYRHLPLKPAP
jgi:hypothetical protein